MAPRRRTAAKNKPKNVNWCHICWEDLSKKRSASVASCRQFFHRTCIVNWIETRSCVKEDLTLQCPSCDAPFTKLKDHRLTNLPELIAFGPTGQPPLFHITTSKMKSVDKRDDYLIKLILITTQWLSQVVEQLEETREKGKCEEYVQDILDEKTKLMDRLDLLHEMKLKWKGTADKIQAASARANPAAPAADNQAPADAAAATRASPESTTNEDQCSICLTALSRMRAVTTKPCNHRFHQSCISRWLESNEAQKCCNCRAGKIEIKDDKNRIVAVIRALEDPEARRLFDEKTVAFRIVEINTMRISASRLVEILMEDRIRAVREHRGPAYVENLDQELAKMKKRVAIMDQLHVELAEKRELSWITDPPTPFTLNRRAAAAAAAAAAPQAAATGRVNPAPAQAAAAVVQQPAAQPDAVIPAPAQAAVVRADPEAVHYEERLRGLLSSLDEIRSRLAASGIQVGGGAPETGNPAAAAAIDTTPPNAAAAPTAPAAQVPPAAAAAAVAAGEEPAVSDRAALAARLAARYPGSMVANILAASSAVSTSSSSQATPAAGSVTAAASDPAAAPAAAAAAAAADAATTAIYALAARAAARYSGSTVANPHFANSSTSSASLQAPPADLGSVRIADAAAAAQDDNETDALPDVIVNSSSSTLGQPALAGASNGAVVAAPAAAPAADASSGSRSAVRRPAPDGDDSAAGASAPQRPRLD